MMKKMTMILSVCVLLASLACAYEDTAIMKVVAIHPRSDGCNINYELILWNEDGYARLVTDQLDDLRLGDMVQVRIESDSGERVLAHAGRLKIIRENGK